jgi:hypothetical protein
MTATMGPKDFRRIVLGLEGAVEGSHMGHPDFRANERIFATLHPDLKSGMVKLTPEQQERFLRDHPGTFMPEPGAWGRSGCTAIQLATVDEDVLGEALTLAWQNNLDAAIARRKKARPPTRAKKKSARGTARRH